MQFWIINARTSARMPTAANLVWTALETFGKVDRCKPSSPCAVIAHNVAINQIESASAILGYAPCSAHERDVFVCDNPWDMDSGEGGVVYVGAGGTGAWIVWPDGSSGFSNADRRVSLGVRKQAFSHPAAEFSSGPWWSVARGLSEEQCSALGNMMIDCQHTFGELIAAAQALGERHTPAWTRTARQK